MQKLRSLFGNTLGLLLLLALGVGVGLLLSSRAIQPLTGQPPPATSTQVAGQPLRETPVPVTSTKVLTTTRTPVVIPVIITTFPTPTPPISSSSIQLQLWGNCSYGDFLEDAMQLNIPVTPIPIQSTPESVSCCPSALNDRSNSTPTVDYLPRLGITTRLDAYAFEAAEHFKDEQQNGIEGLRYWLGERDLVCTPNLCPNDLIAGDFNKDGRMEYILTLSLRKKPFSEEPSECGSFEHPAQRIYLFSCQTNPNYCDVYRIGRLWADADNGGCINSVTDLNNDGQPELLVTYHLCGASDCWDQLEIISLNEGYRYLAPKIEVHNGCIAANDENGDGIVEIFANTTDFPGVLGFLYDGPGQPTYGPFQQYVSVYQWDETEYTLSGRAYNHDCLFHLIWDGIDWFGRGEAQTALAVFEITLTNKDIPLECKSDNVEFPWRTYAQFAVGMLNAQLGHKNKAESALLKAKDIDTENIFSPLVAVFLKAYKVEGYDAACEILTQYVTTLTEDTSFRGPYRFRQLTTFCPNDLMK